MSLLLALQGGVGPQTLTASLLTNSGTLFAPTVTTSAVTLTPSLLTNSSALYTATVTRGAVTLTPALFTNSSTLYPPLVALASGGAQTLLPSLLTNSAALYAPGVSTPGNGPSGGSNWTRGYKPTHDYINQRRRSRRDEILFLRG